MENRTYTSNEELTDEKEARVKADYLAKIKALDERLNGFKTSKLDADKREVMKQANYSDEQIERHIQHIKGDSVDEIEQSVEALKNDFKPANMITYADPSLSNHGIGSRPRQTTAEEGRQLGRKLVKDASKRTYGGRYYG